MYYHNMDASKLYLSQLGEDILIERKWINQKVEDGIFIEIDKSNTDRNKECRDILRKHGFVCDGRMELNEFWINPTYFRKDILYVKPEDPLNPFTITAKTRISNIGYHPYMQHHIIDKITATINNNIKY